ncbi:60S ribosomal protein L11 isoform X2 [Tanacetum coccineum]
MPAIVLPGFANRKLYRGIDNVIATRIAIVIANPGSLTVSQLNLPLGIALSVIANDPLGLASGRACLCVCVSTRRGDNLVQSAANTLPENIENTPKIPKEVEPSPPTPELVVEEPTKDPMVDAPAPVEQPPTTEVPVETETEVVEEPVEETMVDVPAPAEEAPATEVPVAEEPKEETMVDAPAPAEETPTTEVPAETETKVVDVPKSEIEEPKAEATPEEVLERNEKIACYVTVRGDKAMQLLESGLKVKEYELLRRNFSDTGCFGLGKFAIAKDPNKLLQKLGALIMAATSSSYVYPSLFLEATYASNDTQHLAAVLRLFCDFIPVLEPLSVIVTMVDANEVDEALKVDEGPKLNSNLGEDAPQSDNAPSIILSNVEKEEDDDEREDDGESEEDEE